jgi:CRISPR-associated protein Cas4
MIDFNALIDNYLIREHRPKDIGRYYPSEIGGCMRKTWFSYKFPKKTTPELTRIFEAGNMLHEFVAEVIRSEKNPDVELVKEEMPLKLEQKDFVISGRIDNLVLVKVENKEVLVEVKSAKFLPYEPKEQHMMQLQFYMHVTSIHNGMLLYIQKDNLQTRGFEIGYDKEEAEYVIARFEKLHCFLKENKIPPPEAKMLNDMSWMCDYCDYRADCDSQP